MRFFVCAALCLVWAHCEVFAATSFAGSNLYYAAGLTTDQQHTLFSKLQSVGVKVLRVWVDGQTGTVKGTAINGFAGLENDGPAQWNNDEVLNRLDDVMVNAHQYGIKLLISMHSYNTLSANNDFYGRWYGTGYFYTDTNAINYFKQRIAHIMAHVNPHNGKAWSQSSEYIFAFEAQNEAMNGVSVRMVRMNRMIVIELFVWSG
jgi:mannan endo-1,4-beta-mannosidase